MDNFKIDIDKLSKYAPLSAIFMALAVASLVSYVCFHQEQYLVALFYFIALFLSPLVTVLYGLIVKHMLCSVFFQNKIWYSLLPEEKTFLLSTVDTDYTIETSPNDYIAQHLYTLDILGMPQQITSMMCIHYFVQPWARTMIERHACNTK